MSFCVLTLPTYAANGGQTGPKWEKVKGEGRSRGCGSGTNKLRGRGSGGGATEEPLASVPPALSNTNADHYILIMKWQEAVQNDIDMCGPKVDNVPLDIASGGSFAPFDPDAFKAASENGTTYKCGGCFGWQDLLSSPTPGVSINTQKVMGQVHKLYPEGRPTRRELKDIICHNPGGSWDPMAHLGSMKRLSPCEFVHILLGGMYLCISSGQPKSVKQHWQAIRRSMTIQFVKLTSEEMSNGIAIKAINMREDLKKDAEKAAWGTKQKLEFVVMEEHSLHAKLGRKVNEPDLTKHLKAVSSAESSEPMNKSFVDAVLTIDARFLLVPACNAALKKFDNLSPMPGMGPMDSVYKIQVVIQQGRTEDNIVWITQSLLDGYLMGVWANADFAVSKLKTVTCQMTLLQKEMRDWSFRWIDKMGFSPHHNSNIRLLLADHQTVREKLQPFPDEKLFDLSWQSSWPDSSLAALRFGQVA